MSNQFNFNLKLEDYNEQELEELFDLKYPYSVEDIQICKSTIQDKLLQDGNLGENKQQEINNFLENGSQQLIHHLDHHVLQGYPKQHITSFLDRKNKIIQEDSNIIIEHPDRLVGLNSSIVNGRIVDSKKAPPGAINPLNIRTIKKAINIDSRFRPDYYQTKSTDYLITLPTKISKVVSMRVASIELPLTYYAISKAQGNNTFVIIVTDSLSNNKVKKICHLPDGNYEVKFADSLHAFHIEKAVNDAMRQANVPDAIVYTVDHISGKSVFAEQDFEGEILVLEDAPLEILFNVDTDGNEDNTTSLQFRLGWQLGFRTAKYVSQKEPLNLNVWGAIASEGICFPMGPTYAYLGINDFNNNVNDYFVSAFTSSVLSKDIIARLNLVKGIQNEGVSHSADDEGSSTQLNRTRNFFGPVNIEKLKITLYDKYGRILDINNMDWSFTLSFDCLYN
jgi:hypothetical protein